MSLRKVTSLGLNLASVTDFKRIQTPHIYAAISEATNPLQLVGQEAEFKFKLKFEPLPVIWQSLRRLLQKVIKGLCAKSTVKRLGQLSSSACAGRTGEHKHRAFPSRQ